MAEVVNFEKPPATYRSLADLPQAENIVNIRMSTGWPELDDKYQLYPGQLTVLTGLAGSGKSSFVFSLLINMARLSGIRSYLFVPENEQHLRDTLRGMWTGDEAGFQDFARHQVFIESAMPTHYDSEPRDLRWVLDRAVRAIEEQQVSVVVIDPWNELEYSKPPQMLMTDYIREALMFFKAFCRAHDVAAIIVAHPTKAVTERGGRVPLLSDIEGSMSWYNKCDNGLIVDRNFETNTARVISAKVRHRAAGKIGSVHFWVDPETGRFTPEA